MTDRTRLPAETFDIEVQKIRRGYYSAVYFWRTKMILEGLGFVKHALMQVFQKKDAVLCGTDEALAVLRLCTGTYTNHGTANELFDRYVVLKRKARAAEMQRSLQYFLDIQTTILDLEVKLDQIWVDQYPDLRVKSLFDGDRISPWETVMTIEGLPQSFSHLESIYLGILARRTMVATNVAQVVEAANGKPVLFFADRFDHYANQTGDGYAAMVGGAKGVATDSMGSWWGVKGAGTTPHALIAYFHGDTVEASLAFARKYPDIPCISLVDFHNDCVKTSVEVANRFRSEGLTLYGVRPDTSENMVDSSIVYGNQMGREKPTGVTPQLVRNIRNGLDYAGHDTTKITVSGGFDKTKIAYFERVGAPVDIYASGSGLLNRLGDFTADVVMVENKFVAKMGRHFNPNIRLTVVNV